MTTLPVSYQTFVDPFNVSELCFWQILIRIAFNAIYYLVGVSNPGHHIQGVPLLSRLVFQLLMF